MKTSLRIVLRESTVFLISSFLLLIIGLAFRSSENRDELRIEKSVYYGLNQFWSSADSLFAASENEFTKTGTPAEYGVFPLDTAFNALQKSGVDSDKAEAMFRLKIFQWALLIDGKSDVPKTVDDIDKLILSCIDDPYLTQRYQEILPRSMSYVKMQLTGIFPPKVLAGLQYIQSHNTGSGYDQIQADSDALLGNYNKIEGVKESLLAKMGEDNSVSSYNQKKPLEIIVFVSLAMFILSLLVTMASRYLARLITAAAIQDMISGRGALSGFRQYFLPYLFSIPAFILAFAFSGVALPWLVKLLLLLAIMVISGGLSFELVLKYLELSQLEYQKPYVRFLSFYKRDRSKKGIGELMRAIFVPRRHQNLRQSQSVLPFVMTGTDYQLIPHIRRRMAVVADCYALTGLILGFRVWSSKADLVTILAQTARSDGASLDALYLIEALLLGIFLSKLVFIISESRSFPGGEA